MSFTVLTDRSSESRRPWRGSEFVAGVLSTLLGFGLAVLWDQYKYRRDIDQRDVAVIEVLRQEVRGNLELAKQDQKTLSDELILLAKSSTSCSRSPHSR